MLETFYFNCYGDLWSVILDVTAVIFGVPQTMPYKMTNLICINICFDCSIAQLFLHLPSSPWASLGPET